MKRYLAYSFDQGPFNWTPVYAESDTLDGLPFALASYQWFVSDFDTILDTKEGQFLGYNVTLALIDKAMHIRSKFSEEQRMALDIYGVRTILSACLPALPENPLKGWAEKRANAEPTGQAYVREWGLGFMWEPVYRDKRTGEVLPSILPKD